MADMEQIYRNICRRYTSICSVSAMITHLTEGLTQETFSGNEVDFDSFGGLQTLRMAVPDRQES